VEIAKSRNRLLRVALPLTSFLPAGSLVVWMDSDLLSVPFGTLPALWQAMESAEPRSGDVVVPLCANSDGGGAYDLNSWRDTEESRLRAERGEVMFEGYGRSTGRVHMDELAKGGGGKGFTVDLDGVGGTMIVARREGFTVGKVDFPEELFRGSVETEGFGLLAKDRVSQTRQSNPENHPNPPLLLPPFRFT
jgi:hypothetical protein